MIEPISASITLLIGTAPHWFPAVRTALVDKGKELALEKGNEYKKAVLDEKKHQRHMELALLNAAERGLAQWHTPEDHNNYQSILAILSEGQSEALRQEAMQLFTLHNNPDLTDLTERYNLSRRITALAHHTIHIEINAAPYLQSFFEALLASLYDDPLFREQVSDTIKVRNVVQQSRSLTELLGNSVHQSRSLAEILDTLKGMYQTLSDDYSPKHFEEDLNTYLKHIEMCFRLHKFAAIVFRGDEDQAPELDAIFVPLGVEIQQQNAQANRTPDSLLTLLNRDRYVVLLGGPGSGKSTTTRHLTWIHAKTNMDANRPQERTKQRELLVGEPVPLRVELRNFIEARKKQLSYSFLSYTTEVVLKQEDISISPHMFKVLLERRALFVLFDGLDEVPTNERPELVKEIENFAERYPGNYILVTSRPIGYELAPITNPLFLHAEVQSFNNEQIHQFLESWYTFVLHTPLRTEIRKELDAFYTILTSNPHLYKLAVNPLLLTVMTALHRYERLPDRRFLLYEKCAELLLDTWSRFKYEEKTRWKDLKMGKQDQLACISYLGFILHQRSQESTTEDETAVDVPASFIRETIKQFLTEEDLLSGTERNAEADRFLELVQKEAGLIVSRGTNEVGETLFGFIHRTFQEYFAAVHIHNLFQQGDASAIPSFLKQHLHDPHWHEVTLLLFGKLQRKLATSQLRGILKEGTKRSKYSSLVKQDFLFVCTCLADGVLTEENFAAEVLSQLEKMVEETPFPSQRKEALNYLVKLQQIQQYSDLATVNLRKLTATNNLQIQIDLAQSIAQISPAGSEEVQGGGRLLLDFYQQGNLSLEQQILLVEAIYQISPFGSEERREAARIFLNLIQQGNLSLEQQIRLAQAIVQPHPDDSGGSEERREAARIFLNLMQQGNLSLEQQILLVEAIYQISPFGSEERREAARIFLNLIQQGNLSLEQQIRLAQAIVQPHPDDSGGSEERREAARIFLNLIQQGNLSLEQQVLLAQAIYQISPAGLEVTEEQREGIRIFLTRYQQGNLSLEQQILLARAIYHISPYGSDDEREAAHLLLIRYQQGNLSLEQQILLAQAISNVSSYNSEERREATRLLLNFMQQEDLSVEQQILLAQAIYQKSPPDSEDQREATGLLLNFMQQGNLSLEQQILLAQAISNVSSYNSEERREATRLLLNFMQQEDLSVEQQIRLARAIYQISPAGSEEQQAGFELLYQFINNANISREQRLQLAIISCKMNRNNFSERAAVVRVLLTYISSENIANILKENWGMPPLFAIGSNFNERNKSFRSEELITETPAIYELANQEILSTVRRDQLYQVLRDMVPLFDLIE